MAQPTRSQPGTAAGRPPTPDDRPAGMRAVVQTRYGAPERALRLAEVPAPRVTADDDVLIRVRATSVNTPDWITVTGRPPVLRVRSGLRRPRTPIRGTDVAGVVEAVGRGVTDIAPGDEVFGSAWDDSLATVGTFAEYTVAPARQLLHKPEALTFVEAAAAVMSGITALVAVRDVARARPGTRMLVNGASGGVGTFAVQMAARRGAEVTAVCSTRNVELVRSLGAAHVIDYTTEDFTRSARRYDAVLDNVMNHPPTRTAGVLAPDGVLIPNSVGDSERLFAGLPRMARAVLLGRGATNVQFARCEFSRENLQELATLLTSGAVTTVVDRSYPLADAAAAVAHMYSHRARGQVAITVERPAAQ